MDDQTDRAMHMLKKIEIVRVSNHMVELRRKVSGYEDLPFAFIVHTNKLTEHRTIGPAGRYIMDSVTTALSLLDGNLDGFLKAASQSKRDCNGVQAWLQSAVITGGGKTTPAKHPKLQLVS